MIDNLDDKWTSVRLSRDLHKFIGEKGSKDETYNEIISRLVGFKMEENNGI